MIGTVWQSHRSYDSTDCTGTLTVTAKLASGIWIAECDTCSFDIGVHDSRLDDSGPRDVAPQDRTVQSHAADAAESW